MPAPDLLQPSALERCALCPRRCGAARAQGARGICGAGAELKIARAALHMWEEPPISGEAGSGTIFFSGCPLKCVYCQNHEISTGNFGLEVSEDRLVQIMLELQEQGANNINLVTATHFAHLVPGAVARARQRGMALPIVYNTSGYERVEAVRALADTVDVWLTDFKYADAALARRFRQRGMALPIVYNTSGYERVEAVRALADTVDVWLTDFKYADAALARRLSHVADYPLVAQRALEAMAKQVADRGGELWDADGALMKRGIIVRHLVLPGHADDSCAVLDLIWKTVGDVPISVMNQYTPNERVRAAGGELARAVTEDEYELVLDHADELGFTTMFWQEGGAVDESFTPPFDTTGVLRSAASCGDGAAPGDSAPAR